jgi:nicotinamide phosphoribosyltransferase
MKCKPHLTLDSYKLDHISQYPAGTQYVYSNLTARSAAHANMGKLFDNKVVFVGLSGFIQEFLIEAWNEHFFARPKAEVVAEYKRRCDNFLGPDAVRTDHIAALHDLGYLPIMIKALPEGSRVDIKVPFLTIRNTLPQFYWLTNYLETVLSDELWQQCTIATITYEYRRILNKYVELTGSDLAFADWQIHDFSMRGMCGWHGAAKGGAAHLFVSRGTDTLPAIDYLEQYYGADVTKELVAGSVPATEHSVMCMGGNAELEAPKYASFTDGNGNNIRIELGSDELATFHRLIAEVYPGGIVSIVSDTWDFWRVITEYARTLKEVILARKPNALGQAKVVFRPDSGDPVQIITGLRAIALEDLDEDNYFKYDVVIKDGKYYEFDQDFCGDSCNCFMDTKLGREVPEHEVKGAVECLYDIFGGDITAKGYRTLNQRVGLIYGDSITLQRCEEILQRLMAKGFSAGNIVFGVGSYTYQYMTRDTFGMAVKATFGVVNGEERNIQKDPKTGDGMKKSATGLLRIEKEGDKFVLYDKQSIYDETCGELEVVFVDGKQYNAPTFAQIVERLKQ